MKPLFDLHTHTVASGHAFSTLKENIDAAAAAGLEIMGTSDHAPAMPGSTHPIFFTNYKAVREEINGVKILCGVEANIMNFAGELDLDASVLAKMDYVIASLHVPCLQAGNRAENTSALVNAMKNPYVKIIGHPDDDRFPLDYNLLTDAAKALGTALELNNSSFRPTSGRQNADKNARVLLAQCKKKQVPIIMSSDAHIYYDIGGFQNCTEMLRICEFPPELVLNFQREGLCRVLNRIPGWLR